MKSLKWFFTQTQCQSLHILLGICLLAGLTRSPAAQANLTVATTLPDLRALVQEIGGDSVTAFNIAKGTQDPHAIEAKPSFMTRLNRADLIILMGLELESAWSKPIIDGARNPKIREGAPGHLELGPQIDPIEIPNENVSRADGDVHPGGNPHFNLDPIRMGKAAQIIARKMAELDPAHATDFIARGNAIEKRLTEKTKLWAERIKKTGHQKVVTYHKTLNYFFDRFGIECPAQLEPKPGIPPTSGHLINVIRLIKEKNIRLILVENFYDPSVTRKIEQAVPGLKTRVVPVLVEGTPEVKTVDDLFETLVRAMETNEWKPSNF